MRFTSLFVLVCISYASANVVSHESGEYSAHELSDNANIRTIYGNDTVPWGENEPMRIRVLSEDVNAILEFNCQATGIPDICVLLLPLSRTSHLPSFRMTAKHVLWNHLYVVSAICSRKAAFIAIAV